MVTSFQRSDGVRAEVERRCIILLWSSENWYTGIYRYIVCSMDFASTSANSDVDAALLADLRAGANDAYRRLVQQHGGRMLAVARRIVDDDEAKDCVQDAFLQAFRKIDTFQENSTLATWLHRIVVNAALMRRRKRNRHAEVSLDSLMPIFDDTGCRIEPAYTLLDEPDLAERTEVRTAVLNAIGQLPDDSRQLILLRDVQGLNTDQTAEELGISVSAAKVRLYRARAALKRLLEPAFGAQSSSTTEGEK